MTLFDINKEIRDCIDLDTGEILDEERLRNLQIGRHEKRRNYVFAIMNLSAMAKACREQEERFKHRRERAKKTIKWLRDTLQDDLAGQTMTEPEFTISYRMSQVVDIQNEDMIPRKFTSIEYKPDKNAIKTAIKAGEKVAGAILMNKQNMVIR